MVVLCGKVALSMIPLFKPFVPDLPDINKVLKSGNLGYGEYTKLFENQLKKLFNNEFLMATNSYSSAIEVMLNTLGITQGDEIIMSPMCCLASTQPYVSKGIKIIWADIDPKTGTLSPESVENRISDKTKLIVHNHFCGFPGYINEINRIGKKHDILVLDDGIECFGSKYNGNLIGNCGTDITIFSLSAVRIPNTIDGGIIIFQQESLYKKALITADLGIDRSKFRDCLGEIDVNCDVSTIGTSAKMSNVNGYIGFEYLKHLNGLLSKQYENSKKWDETTKGKLDKIVINNSEPNYWVYGILVKDKLKTIKHFRDLGLYASGVHIDNSRYSVFGHSDRLPGVVEFENSFVAIPCGWWLSEGDIKYDEE